MADDGSFFNSDNLKTAFDIGKTLVSFARQAESKGLDSQYAAELNGKIADMQFALIDAQSDALASQEAQSKQSARIKELEQTISGFDDWEAERARYRLVNASGNRGAFVYLLREEIAEDEPLHYICPKCYGGKIKSILQLGFYHENEAHCPECMIAFSVETNIARSHGVMQ